MASKNEVDTLLRKASQEYSTLEIWLSRLPIIIFAYFAYYLGEFGNIDGANEDTIRGIILIFIGVTIWLFYPRWPVFRRKDTLPVIFLILLFLILPYHYDWWWWEYHGGGQPIHENYVDRLDKSTMFVFVLVFTYLLPDKELGRFIDIRYLLILFVLLYIKLFTILTFPNPDIDVWQALMMGPDYLFEGINPYQASYPSNYYQDGSIFFYPPGIILLLSPIRLLNMDIRYLYLFVEFLGAWILYTKLGKNKVSEIYSLPLLVLPWSYFFLHYAWTELVISIFIILLIFIIDKEEYRYYTAVLFGILGTLKQSMWLLLPFYGLYLLIHKKKRGIEESGIAIVVFSVIMLPFFIWSPTAFFGDLWEFPQTQIRLESLTINSYFNALGWPLIGINWFLVVYVISLVLFTLYIVKFPNGASLAIFKFGLTMLFLFFFMGLLAFMNHYHLILIGYYVIMIKTSHPVQIEGKISKTSNSV